MHLSCKAIGRCSKNGAWFVQQNKSSICRTPVPHKNKITTHTHRTRTRTNKEAKHTHTRKRMYLCTSSMTAVHMFCVRRLSSNAQTPS